jgi:hypothetical protein
MSSVPQWNADIITPDSEASAEIISGGGLEKDAQGAIGVKVDESTIVINQEGALGANIPTPDTVDQSYDAASTHAQSGTAVADALSGLATVASTGDYQDLTNTPVFGTTSI